MHGILRKIKLKGTRAIEWSRIEQHGTEVLLVCCAAKHAPRQASEQANEQRHQQQPKKNRHSHTANKLWGVIRKQKVM